MTAALSSVRSASFAGQLLHNQPFLRRKCLFNIYLSGHSDNQTPDSYFFRNFHQDILRRKLRQPCAAFRLTDCFRRYGTEQIPSASSHGRAWTSTNSGLPQYLNNDGCLLSTADDAAEKLCLHQKMREMVPTKSPKSSGITNEERDSSSSPKHIDNFKDGCNSLSPEPVSISDERRVLPERQLLSDFKPVRSKSPELSRAIKKTSLIRLQYFKYGKPLELKRADSLNADELYEFITDLLKTKPFDRNHIDAQIAKLMKCEYSHLCTLKIMNKILYYYLILSNDRKTGMQFFTNQLKQRFTPDIYSYNIILRNHFKAIGKPGDKSSFIHFVRFLREMSVTEIVPDSYTWGMILRLCRDETMPFFAVYFERNSIEISSFMMSTMIQKSMKATAVTEWMKLCLRSDFKSIYSYSHIFNTILKGILESDISKDLVRDWLATLETRAPLPWNAYSYIFLVRSAAREGSFEHLKIATQHCLRCPGCFNDKFVLELINGLIQQQKYEHVFAVWTAYSKRRVLSADMWSIWRSIVKENAEISSLNRLMSDEKQQYLLKDLFGATEPWIDK